MLTHLQRKEQEEARLELQKAAQNSRVALDILKLVQSGQIAAADQLHRQAADLQRWWTDMLRLITQGEIEEAKNQLQERIHNERMTLAWAQHNQRVFIDLQRLQLDASSAFGNGPMVSVLPWTSSVLVWIRASLPIS